MFPAIYTSSSSLYILAPSYNPLMEPYTREVGSFAITGADFRSDRGTTGSRAGSRMKSIVELAHRCEGLGEESPADSSGTSPAPVARDPVGVGLTDGPGDPGWWTRWEGKPV